MCLIEFVLLKNEKDKLGISNQFLLNLILEKQQYCPRYNYLPLTSNRNMLMSRQIS